MFSSKERLDKRTGSCGIGRLQYLQSLVTEFQETINEEAKLQLAANMANFAYDPINYEYLKVLKIIDLFLDCIAEGNDKLVRFAIAGICNMIIDEDVKDDILSSADGLTLIMQCLNRSDEETLLSTLTVIYYLFPLPGSLDIAILDGAAAHVSRLSSSSCSRISNLAHIIMEQRWR